MSPRPKGTLSLSVNTDGRPTIKSCLAAIAMAVAEVALALNRIADALERDRGSDG